ncbi:MAG: MlaD family protein [Spirochaetaceae bacterium]|nr:MlaD family protein [Spirochaetaceae bacterium]
MKFKIQFANQIVGIFILGALFSFAGILIMMAVSQRWFAKNYYYTSIFPSGKGLEQGMPITFKGFEIGKITDIYLTEDNNVKIEFYIQDRYQPKVFENSVLQLASSMLGFGGGLVFHQGTEETAPLEEGSHIPSLDMPEGQYLVQTGRVRLPRDDDPLTRVLESVEPVLENVRGMVDSIDRILLALNEPEAGDSAVGDLMKNLVRTTTEVSSLLRLLNTMARDPQGLVVNLVDPEYRLFGQIESILSDAASSMDEVKNFSTILSTARPQILELLEEGTEAIRLSQDVLEGLRNNPLLSGGITPRLDTPTTQQGYRNEIF